MDSKKKTYIPIGIMGLIVIVSCILFFFPNLVGYENSYVAIKEKKEEVLANNEKMKENEIKIERLNEEMKFSKKSAEKEDAIADEYESKVGKDDFVLSIPNFLIKMEQEAVKDKVSLKIDYAAMKSSDSTTEEQGATETPEGNADSAASSTSQTEGSEASVQPGTEPEGAKETTNSQTADSTATSQSSEEVKDDTIPIEGIENTIIPIEISGSYKNVRDYLSFLDKVGLIKPTSISLESNGKKVTGKIVLNIRNGEVKR